MMGIIEQECTCDAETVTWSEERQLAEEALGYPPDGREHLEALIVERRHWIGLRDQTIKDAQRDKSAFLRQIDDFQKKLAALKQIESQAEAE